MAYIGICPYCKYHGVMDNHSCREEIEYWKNKAEKAHRHIRKIANELKKFNPLHDVQPLNNIFAITKKYKDSQ